MTRVTCRLTAKNRDQLRNPALGNQVWAIFLRSILDTRDDTEIWLTTDRHIFAVMGSAVKFLRFVRSS